MSLYSVVLGNFPLSLKLFICTYRVLVSLIVGISIYASRLVIYEKGKNYLFWGKTLKEKHIFAIEYDGSVGEYYIGDFKEKIFYGYKRKMRDGYGVLQNIFGDVYNGSFKDDKKDGDGILYCSNGDVYEGLWENDKDVKILYHRFDRNWYSSFDVIQEDEKEAIFKPNPNTTYQYNYEK